MSQNITLEIIGDEIALLKIINPPANALSRQLKSALLELIVQAESNPKLRVLILTGHEDKFCCGDDLGEAKSNLDNPQAAKENLVLFGTLIQRIEKLPLVTIAAVNGWCIGGGLELALACDLRIGSEDAKFKAVSTELGLSVSAVKLASLLGLAHSRYMLYTTNVIDASQALQYGLISELHTALDFEQAYMKLAKNITSKAPLAIKSTKEIFRRYQHNSIEELNEFAANELFRLAESEDYKNAVISFSKKEKPRFEGK